VVVMPEPQPRLDTGRAGAALAGRPSSDTHSIIPVHTRKHPWHCGGQHRAEPRRHASQLGLTDRSSPSTLPHPLSGPRVRRSEARLSALPNQAPALPFLRSGSMGLRHGVFVRLNNPLRIFSVGTTRANYAPSEGHLSSTQPSRTLRARRSAIQMYAHPMNNVLNAPCGRGR